MNARPAPGQGTEAADPVPPLEALVPYLVFRISRRLNARVRERMRHEGVTIHRWRVVSVLAARSHCSLSELADYTVMEQSVISRVADQMVRDGLVKRGESAADRRVAELRLTARGRALFKRLWPAYEQHGNSATGALTEAERRTLVRLLQRVLASMEGEQDELDDQEEAR